VKYPAESAFLFVSDSSKKDYSSRDDAKGEQEPTLLTLARYRRSFTGVFIWKQR